MNEFSIVHSHLEAELRHFTEKHPNGNIFHNSEKIDQAREHLRVFNKKYNWPDTESEYLDTVAGLIALE